MQLAHRIRELYIQERRDWVRLRHGEESDYRPPAHWDRYRDENGQVRKNSWLAVAEFVERNQLDSEQWIRWLFETYSRNGPALNFLKSEKLLTQYENTREQRRREDRREIVLAWQHQYRECSRQMRTWRRHLQGWTEGEIRQFVLTHETLELSALFRFCLARWNKETAVAEIYRDRAIQQYGRDREHYDEIWGNWIPRELSQASTL